MMGRHAVMASAAALLVACQPTGEDRNDTVVNEAAPVAPAEPNQPPTPAPPVDQGPAAPPPAAVPPAGNAAGPLPPPGEGLRFVGRWAAEERLCADTAWRFTERSLRTPAGSACTFSKVTPAAGGYDIEATCTAEGPPTKDRLTIRFAESAKAMLFESDTIADAGLIYCGAAD